MCFLDKYDKIKHYSTRCFEKIHKDIFLCPRNFHEKILRIGGAGHFFLVYLNKNKQPFHMR